MGARQIVRDTGTGRAAVALGIAVAVLTLTAGLAGAVEQASAGGHQTISRLSDGVSGEWNGTGAGGYPP